MSKTPKRLTNSEREIMQVLWKSEKPLTASGIIAASPNKEWKNSSVHLLIKSLLDKDLVEVAGFEKTTKNYARTFKPTMSYEDYSIKFMLNDTDKEKLDILPRINPWDSLDYNNITTPYRSGYSMIFQDLATIGVPHLGWYFLAAGQMPVPISLS